MTYLTNTHDIKHFKFDFLWMFRGLVVQTIKMEHGFNSGGWHI